MTRGRFITLEGGEGAGKSTQAKRLAEWLGRRGIEVKKTREVGGCPGAEDIRDLWLSKSEGFWEPDSELLLVTAARKEHIAKIIAPALARGVWVVSDRFVDSARAYQGLSLGLGLEKTDALYRMVAGAFQPDLTLYLDLPVETGLARMAARRGPDDRYQQKPKAFHEKLRAAYLKLAALEPARIKTIDASGDADQVEGLIAEQVAASFGLSP
jgi:dTMP kinase